MNKKAKIAAGIYLEGVGVLFLRQLASRAPKGAVTVAPSPSLGTLFKRSLVWPLFFLPLKITT